MDRKLLRVNSLFLAILALSLATFARATAIHTAPVSAVVTDAETGKPVANAVVHLTWIAHPSSTEGVNVLFSSRGALSLELVTDRGGRFQAKSATLSLPKDYEITHALDPVITMYASGYRRARFTSTALAGNALMLEPLSSEADSQRALDRELALWREDIDQRRDPNNWVSAAAARHSSERRLVALFKRDCESVHSGRQPAACSPHGGDAGTPQLVVHPAQHDPTPDIDAGEPSKTVTIGTASQPSVQQIEASPNEVPK